MVAHRTRSRLTLTLSILALIAWFGSPASLAVDTDGDGVEDGLDCRPLDLSLWSAPGPAWNLALEGHTSATLTWNEPVEPGCVMLYYEVLISGAAGEWGSASCIAEATTATILFDETPAAAGETVYYLVRGINACGEHLGFEAGDVPRTAAACDPIPKSLGELCNLNAECESGICSDERCCETLCAGVCERCDVTGFEGFCEPAVAGTDPDDECAAQPVESCGTMGDCTADGTCEVWPAGTACGDPVCQSQTVSYSDFECDGLGACAASTVDDCRPYACDQPSGLCKTSCSGTDDCVYPYVCGPSGTCGLPNGWGCGSDSSCASGWCTDGYCCNSRCETLCRSCDQPGYAGTCRFIPAGQDPDDECASEDIYTCGQTGYCSGGSYCQLYPDGQLCRHASCHNASTVDPADYCDGAGTCVDSLLEFCDPFTCAGAVCNTSCDNDSECRVEYQCTYPNGNDCLLRDGQVCEFGHECFNGACCDAPGGPVIGECVNLNTNDQHCGTCFEECADVHGINTCVNGVCNPVCTGYWGDCDGQPEDGCEQSLLTVDHCGACGAACPDRPHSTPACDLLHPSPPECVIGSCDAGWADCDGGVTNGCETGVTFETNNHANAIYVGSMCGDSRCGFPCRTSSWQTLAQFNGKGTIWYRAHADECNVTCTNSDLYLQVTLTPPAGSDFDLYLYDENGALLQTQSHPGSVAETVTYSRSDSGISGYDYWIKVQWVSGPNCAQWHLRFQGRDC